MSYSSRKGKPIKHSTAGLVGEGNKALVQQHPLKLGFMMDAKGKVQNPRAALPSAKAIYNFNKSGRTPVFAITPNRDMTTATGRQVAGSGFKLRTGGASRNHKLSDKSGGDMINRAIIKGRLGTPKVRSELAGGFKNLLDSAERPMAKSTRAQKRKRNQAEDVFAAMLDPANSVTAAGHQRGLKRAKLALTSALPNLRLGEADLNSGIGPAQDPNLLGPNRPPTPISSMFASEVDSFAALPALGMSQAERDSITTPATSGGKFVGSSNL